MTPEEISLVQTSLIELSSRSGELTRTFYDRLFELDPAARSMFPEDLDEQRAKFFAELSAIARAISDLDAFVARGLELGRLHQGYGVRFIDYQHGGAALVAALGDVLGASMTPALEAAWRSAYHLVSQVMLSGGAQS